MKSYSVEISYDGYDPLSLRSVWAEEEQAMEYATALDNKLHGYFRSIVVKQWVNGIGNVIERISGVN